jgi:hypothetical protein
MGNIHPRDIGQAYRLGSQQAATELQQPAILRIHIEFEVINSRVDVSAKWGQAIFLTGTPTGGNAYLRHAAGYSGVASAREARTNNLIERQPRSAGFRAACGPLAL